MKHYCPLIACVLVGATRPPPISVPTASGMPAPSLGRSTVGQTFDFFVDDEDLMPLGLYDPGYADWCRSELVPMNEWDSYLDWFTSEERPSVRVGSTQEPESDNAEEPSGSDISIPLPTSPPGYAEPRLYRSKAVGYGSFRRKRTKSHHANGCAQVFPGSPERDEIVEQLRSLIDVLNNDPHRSTKDYSEVLVELEPIVNEGLYSILQTTRRMQACNCFDCSIWVAILEQTHYRTVMHFSQRPGDWNIFQGDLSFVLQVLVNALDH